jgi:hypothetical protein
MIFVFTGAADEGVAEGGAKGEAKGVAEGVADLSLVHLLLFDVEG